MSKLHDGTPLDSKIKIDENAEPIARLTPGSDHHAFVLEYLRKRIKASEDQMSRNYDRWNIAERKHQAYMNLPNREKILKDMNDRGLPPQPTIIIFPYQYAVTSTIVTYLTRLFCARKPIFPLGATNMLSSQNVKAMETALQYNADHARLVRTLFQLFLDGEMYGLGITRQNWTEEYNYRPTWRETSPLEKLQGATARFQRTSQLTRTYSGNSVTNIDPFMFFPDPNVPMALCAEKGEFVFWRDFIGKHILLQEETYGTVRYISNIPDAIPTGGSHNWYNLSVRNLLTKGDSHAGGGARGDALNTRAYMIDQGSVEIIPSELGLGLEERPVKYLFTIANQQQIIQAQPLNMDHVRHPIAVAEPYTMGYGFSQPSLSDYIGPIQDIVSWFLDSHIYNVRASLNNMFLVDPSKVEMQDVLNPNPGKIIRLKPTAIGTDVRTVMQQLPVSDVTRAHVADMDAFIRIGDTVSAVNDNLRGMQETGGRKTATEVRVTGDSASTRLAAHGHLISEQYMTELARQMMLNIQQNQDEEFSMMISGGEWQSVTPMGLSGDFLYQVSDGSLPIDKVAQLEVWKEILQGVAQDQELRASYSLPAIFEWVASELGGAPNIKSFRRQPTPTVPGAPAGIPQIQPDIQNPQQIEAGVRSGQLAPVNGNFQ